MSDRDKETPAPSANRVTGAGTEARQQADHTAAVAGAHQAPVRGDVPLAALTAEINKAYNRAYQRGVMMLHDMRLAGELLTKARDRVDHGGWLDYVRGNLPFGDRQARKYMRLHREWQRLDVSINQPESIDSAMALLAAPAEESEPANRNSNSDLDAVRVSETPEDDIGDPATIAGEFERVADTTAESVTELARQFKSEVAQAVEEVRRGFERARIVGEHLLKAKSVLPDDEWLPWLAANTEVSEARAQNYMSVAQNWDEIRSMTDPDVAELLAGIVDSLIPDGGGA